MPVEAAESGTGARKPILGPRIRAALERPLASLEETPVTVADAIVQAMVKSAVDIRHGGSDRDRILDRLDGPVIRESVNLGVQVIIREYGGSGSPADIG